MNIELFYFSLLIIIIALIAAHFHAIYLLANYVMLHFKVNYQKKKKKSTKPLHCVVSFI